MKQELERRSYTFDVSAEETESGNIIEGRPIVYNSRTDIGFFDEIIESGALDKTDLTDVRFLVNHDTSKIPLARSRRNNGNSTMQLFVDNEGMRIKVALDTDNNSEAKALYSAVKRGDISGMSFMFGVRGEEWDDLDSEHPTRRITDIASVVEVSAVTFPAYEATEIYTRSKEALESARSAVETARQRGVENSVETEINHEIDLAKAKFNFKAKY
jgi:HK97 family phage prohead protease